MNRYVLFMMLACCTTSLLPKGSPADLEERLQNLATPILQGPKMTIGERDNILLRKPDKDGDMKRLNDFLKGDFIKFIGSDDKKRKAYAESIRDDIGRLLNNIFVIVRDLMVFAGREKFGQSEQELSGSGAQATMAQRKYAKLEMVDVLDPALIPWGTSAKAGTAKVSVDHSVIQKLPTLSQARSHVRTVEAFAQSGQAACIFQPCKDRFGLLLAANNVLNDLIKKLDIAIIDLKKAEQETLRKAKRR